MAALWWMMSSAFLMLFLHHADGQVYEYNVACPPPQRPSEPTENGCVLVMYGGPIATNITINSSTQLWFKILAPGERYEFEVDRSYVVSSGVEEKRLRIFTSEEISIVIQKQDFQDPTDRFVGATEVYESRFGGYEFYPVSRPQGCTGDPYNNAYYTIVPSREKTRLAVYQNDVYIRALVLFEYEVFTNVTNVVSDMSTIFIMADAPVSVFSGCACVGSVELGSHVSTVPPVGLYGTQFIAPPLQSASGVSQYRVRILAAEDFTMVVTENINEVLDRGGMLTTTRSSDEALEVMCSNPCLVVLFSVSDSDTTEFGNFQMNLVDRGNFYTSAAFSTLHDTGSNFVSITVIGEPPYLGLSLDEESLDEAEWMAAGGYGFLNISVSEGGHFIESQDRELAAYVYGHLNEVGGGYGYEVRLYGDFEPQPTLEPTVPTTTEGAETFEYTAACVPSHHNTLTFSGCDLLVATNDELAQVTMTNGDMTWEFVVRRGLPFTMTMDQEYHLTSGVEEKRLRIVSDKELFVTTTKKDLNTGDTYIDTNVWPEKKAAGSDFYILQEDSSRHGCTGSTLRKAFYAFVSFEPATFIEVYDADDELESVVLLGMYGSFSRFTNNEEIDWRGLRVFATNPIAVITGTLCQVDGSTGTYLATLPAISDYGEEFVVPSIAGPPVPASYAVHILASEDGTFVEQDGLSYPLNKGDTVIFDYDTIHGIDVITCSIRCLAVLFQHSTEDTIGNFMTSLIPSDQFYRYRYFSTADLSITHYVTIIVDGLPPIDDIFLDDESLEHLMWGSRGGYSVARVEVSRGQHHIESTGLRRFAAYVYGHTGSDGGGYGYAI